MVTLYYVKRPLYVVQTIQTAPVNSGHLSSFLQQKVLEPLYVDLAAIKPVEAWNFLAKNLACD